MKEIDESIKEALRDAALESGSVLKLSRKFGVSHSTVLFWGNGRTRRIDGDVWRYKVFPVIEPYLRRRGGVRLALGGPASYGRGVSGFPPASLHEVPVIGLNQAGGFDPALEPFDSYARSCGRGTAFFATEPKAGCFALRVEDGGMEPDFPDGTLLLVAGGEFVESGDIVLARVRASGQVIIKRHVCEGEMVRLEALNPAGLAFAWNKNKERGFLEWMHPVIEAKVDLRSRKLEAVGA